MRMFQDRCIDRVPEYYRFFKLFCFIKCFRICINDHIWNFSLLCSFGYVGTIDPVSNKYKMILQILFGKFLISLSASLNVFQSFSNCWRNRCLQKCIGDPWSRFNQERSNTHRNNRNGEEVLINIFRNNTTFFSYSRK
mgnify:CR=1 FL=1